MPTVREQVHSLPSVETEVLTTVGEGHYWAPNDEKQNNHQSILYAAPFCASVVGPRCGPDLIRRHHLFLLTFNDKLFLAPIENPLNVLDVGTGTGIWAQ